MPDVRWCESCERSPCWACYDQCVGCLDRGAQPCEVVPLFAIHWDLPTAMAEIRRKRAQWEVQHPAWELVPDYQRLNEESAAPSRHVDSGATIGRKRVWSRFRVERKHPRGRRVQPVAGMIYLPNADEIAGYGFPATVLGTYPGPVLKGV